MSCKYWEIDTDALLRDASTLRENLRDMQEAVKQMRCEMEALNGQWSGPANLVYRAEFNNSCEVLEAHCKETEKYIESLEGAAKDYKNCEVHIHQAVDAIRI